MQQAGYRMGRARIAIAALVMVAAGPALAAEPYVGLWANDPKDCASKTAPPLTKVDEAGAYWGEFFCPSGTFTRDGEASWIVHLECSDPMAGPGDGDTSWDYRFTVAGDTLHWDPVGEGTGSVLTRCPN